MKDAETLIHLHVLGRECRVTRIGTEAKVEWRNIDSPGSDWDPDLAVTFPFTPRNLWNQTVLIQAALVENLTSMIDEHFASYPGSK